MLTSRSGSQGSSTASPPQTIEAVRRRARHRLIGAAVLVMVGVLGFPLLFDTEPRPVAGDIPIEIPSRGEIQPIVVAQANKSSGSVSEAPAGKQGASEAAMAASDGLDDREVVVERDQAEPKRSEPSIDTSAKSSSKRNDEAAAAAAAAEAKKEAAKREAAQKESARKAQLEEDKAEKAKKAAAESDRARALLENKAPAGTERLVVQVGAFAEAGSARATRLKLERAGLTTYTHVAETSAGKLIRVRVGPFTSRSEADKVAAKVKSLGLPARILTL